MMRLLKFLPIILALCSYVEAQTRQDCKYAKFSPNHTMCKQKNATCEVMESGVSAVDAEAIIAIHNELRQKVASGNESPQPPAANMMKMAWDEELASLAQRLADQCVFAADCAECRQIERFQPGQNLHLYSYSPLSSRDKIWKDIITGWYNRVEKFNPLNVDKFQFAFESSTYSQVVWSETQFVGCGLTTYKDDKWYRNLYVCDYGPSGNVIGDAVYVKGTGCSKCPNGTTCSKEYPSLCENQAELDLRVLEKSTTSAKPKVEP